MKKISKWQRLQDVKRVIRQRRIGAYFSVRSKRYDDRNNKVTFDWKHINDWIDNERRKGLIISEMSNGKKRKKNVVALHLPKLMNFSNNYSETVQCLTAIRKLVLLLENMRGKIIPKKAFKLASVNFSNLTSISTSAALVLTAEVSKWNFAIRKKLTPKVENWNENIYMQFEQLGFFDLFDNKPQKMSSNDVNASNLDFVRYVRGQCGDSEDAKDKKRKLKEEIVNLVGDRVDKWTILHSGLTEAVTNVTHHAYPNEDLREEKSWYLTGSYDKNSKDMKIAFFDQGIGIPNSLPASEIWEKVLNYLSKLNIPVVEQKKHARLLEAAVSIDRTSTGQNDRGKGLQDLLEFIKERGEGYLSIISYHGLYKSWIENGKQHSKTEGMARPLLGTLIIWSVRLS